MQVKKAIETTREMDISEKENVNDEIVLDSHDDERIVSEKSFNADVDDSGVEDQEPARLTPASTSSDADEKSVESTSGCSQQAETTTPKSADRCRVVVYVVRKICRLFI